MNFHIKFQASSMKNEKFEKMLTSEVEVEVEAEVKIEVRSIWGLSRSTSIQNFGLLTSKITELWLF